MGYPEMFGASVSPSRVTMNGSSLPSHFSVDSGERSRQIYRPCAATKTIRVLSAPPLPCTNSVRACSMASRVAFPSVSVQTWLGSSLPPLSLLKKSPNVAASVAANFSLETPLPSGYSEMPIRSAYFSPFEKSGSTSVTPGACAGRVRGSRVPAEVGDHGRVGEGVGTEHRDALPGPGGARLQLANLAVFVDGFERMVETLEERGAGHPGYEPQFRVGRHRVCQIQCALFPRHPGAMRAAPGSRRSPQVPAKWSRERSGKTQMGMGVDCGTGGVASNDLSAEKRRWCPFGMRKSRPAESEPAGQKASPSPSLLASTESPA